MTEIYFDEAAHTYTVEGRVIPGITEILTKTGIIPYMGPHTDALDVGTKVHKAIELELEEQLDRASAEWLLPYVDNAIQWLKGSGVGKHVESVEGLVYCDKFAYATLIDVIALDNDNNIAVLVNWKTGQKYPWHGIQAAAEYLAFASWYDAVWEIMLYTVYLTDEDYVLPVSYDDAELQSNLDVWQSACHVYNWICSNGGITRPKPQKTTPVVLPVKTDIFEREHRANQENHINRPEEGLFN